MNPFRRSQEPKLSLAERYEQAAERERAALAAQVSELEDLSPEELRHMAFVELADGRRDPYDWQFAPSRFQQAIALSNLALLGVAMEAQAEREAASSDAPEA